MKLEAIQILEYWTHEKKKSVQIIDVMEKKTRNKEKGHPKFVKDVLMPSLED